MRSLSLPDDIRALDGTLLVRAGENIDKNCLRKIRGISRRRHWKLRAVQNTFLCKDFEKALLDERYTVIFEPPKTKEKIIETVRRTKLEEGLIAELKRMKRRDPYTYHHILIVVALTVKEAITIKKFRFNKYIAAQLSFGHDLGKTRIPLKILNKATHLTRSEHEMLRSHPLIGTVLLNYYGLRNRAICSLSAFEHHERLNGTGYPRGIKRMSKYTCLIAPNDVLDALLTSRPYRKTCYTLRQALDFLLDAAKRNAFDKDVVLTLVSYARKDKPSIRKMKVSIRKRGKPPKDRIYGRILE